MILYRLKPNKHFLLSRVLLSVSYLELLSTIAETGLIFWLWGSLWSKWTLPFKVITPILHTLFSLAQLWGFWVLRKLSQKELQKLRSCDDPSQPSPNTDDALEHRPCTGKE